MNHFSYVKYIVLVMCLSMFCTSNLFSQSAEDFARAELERRGLADEEVRDRLLEKGIDVDKIDINDPTQIFKIEKSLKEVIAELEKEKSQSAVTSGSNSTSSLDTLGPLSEEESKIIAKEGEDISKAIDDGATLEEAVSEELVEAEESFEGSAKTYGQEIFRSQNIKLYRQSQDVKPPASYILGVGDILSVAIWGYSEQDLVFEINNDGYIKPEGIPRIYLKGLRLGDARELLNKRFSNYYRFNDNEFEVALSYGRTINVNIVGEVYNFGNFNIPAINNAFNALVAAGGPNNNGSVRNISLKRYGQPDKTIDVYEYLLDPSYQNDYFLEEGDIIYVPVAQKIVNLKGAVIRPNTYELNEKEDLADIIKYAGGLKANASLKNIQITRFENDKEVLLDVNLNDILRSNRDYKLYNGDKIFINSITEGFKNYVEIEGAVDFPGRYSYREGEKVADVLKRLNFLEDAYLDKAILKRIKDDKVSTEYITLNINEILSNTNAVSNLALNKNDKINIYRKSRFLDNQSISVKGEVRSPGDYPYAYDSSIDVEEVLLISGGLKQYAEDFAYVKRKSPVDPKKFSYLRIDLSTNQGLKTLLEPNDEVVFYSKNDNVEEKNINIAGYINLPNSYAYGEGLTLKDAINLGGGLKEFTADFVYIERIDPEAPKEKQYYRIDLNGKEDGFFLQPNDRIVFYSMKDFIDEGSVTINGSIRNPGEYVYGQNMSISDVITMSGGLTFNASRKRVDVYRLDFGDENETRTLEANLILNENNVPLSGRFDLQPFDKIVVRQAPEFELIKSVVIEGEVRYPGTYAIISDNEKLSSLIERAGGLTNEAFPEGGQLLRASSETTGYVSIDMKKAVEKTKSPQNVVLQQYDKINIPKKQSLITILGAVKSFTVYNDDVINQGKIIVPYEKGKTAMHYINNYAGGLNKNADKSNITVTSPNGRVKSTGRFLFWRKYPKVEEGATINVFAKPVEIEEENGNGTDWSSILTSTVAQATSLLTLLLLVQRID